MAASAADTTDPGALADRVADLALAILRNAYLTDQVISLDGGMDPR